MPTRAPILAAVLFAAVCLHVIPSCAPGAARAERPGDRGSSDIAALVDSRPVYIADLHDELAERAGAGALEEHVLSDLLERIARERGIEITSGDIADEQESLLRIISDRSDSGPALIEQVRAARGLGPTRYPKLLRRNAILRALVERDAGAMGVVDAEVRAALDLARSPSAEVRLGVFRTVGEADDARRAVESAEPDAREWVFARRAADSSVHPSAPRGGYIARMRVRDPAYPTAITNAVRDLGPGEMSGIVGTEDGAALVYVLSKSPGRELDPGEVDTITRRARAVAVSARMELLAREILDAADIIVMDGSVSWSWRAGR